MIKKGKAKPLSALRFLQTRIYLPPVSVIDATTRIDLLYFYSDFRRKMQVVQPNKEEYQDEVIVKTAISFGPFIRFLKEKYERTRDARAKFMRFIIKKFELRPDLLRPFTNTNRLEDAEELMELLKAMLFPLSDEDNDNLIALSMPFHFKILYASEPFRKAFLNENGYLYLPAGIDHEQLQNDKLLYLYKFILEKFYQINLSVSDDLLYAVPDQDTGLTRYYRIVIDTRFIDLKYSGKKLPDIHNCVTVSGAHTVINFDQLSQALPLDKFRLEGFSIWNVQDITQEQSLNEIKNTILTAGERTNYENYELLEKSFSTLLNNKDVAVSILPFLKVNNRFVFDEDFNSARSLVFKAAGNNHLLKSAFIRLLEGFSTNPAPMVVSFQESKDITSYPFLEPLFQQGFQGYVCYPVLNNTEVIGVLELASKNPYNLGTGIFAKLDTAFPLLAQALDGYRDRFNEQIEKIIKDKFTSVQQAVEWKFIDAAWDYLKQGYRTDDPRMGKIIFEEVTPLYGAIDIRNSSLYRNLAIQKDITVQLSLAKQILDVLHKNTRLTILKELLVKNNRFLAGIEHELTAEDEIKVNDFLTNEVEPVFQHLKKVNGFLHRHINIYLQEVSNNNSRIYFHRREYEDSLDTINKAINKYLDKEKSKMQMTYPNYFEKYKSDGVEYNIYAGQSIAPQKAFDTAYVHNLRLWQIRSMAEIALITQKLLPTLKVPLETTQLILIHSHPIDISFRRDERRFDVDGAYNIRYEIIKKRIDKVHIHGTGERLTQPGKIAMVYTSAKEADEYNRYIGMLQQKQLLLNDIEHLELEEMQGVAGLKAIRVGVNFSTG